MLGHKSLQITPFLRKVWIWVPNRVPAGGVDEVLFAIFGEPFFLVRPSWPPDPPQRGPRTTFVLILEPPGPINVGFWTHLFRFPMLIMYSFCFYFSRIPVTNT